jgi:hypothetical protein
MALYDERLSDGIGHRHVPVAGKRLTAPDKRHMCAPTVGANVDKPHGLVLKVWNGNILNAVPMR